MGNPSFPFFVVNPYPGPTALEWSNDDWDPALRFWTLPYDPLLTEWLKSTDTWRPSIQAAREFGSDPTAWLLDRANMIANGFAEAADFKWLPDDMTKQAERKAAFDFIKNEIEDMKMLMQDDRERYLAEIEAQADGVPDYFLHFVGATWTRHPWTVELVSCALAISNIVYMRYKALFRRARPSKLCPGLIPAFGPPAHPAFPSGHSTASHLIALLLLKIPALEHRFGKFADAAAEQGGPVALADLAGAAPVNSPLIWLAARMAKGRERLGVHYASDSNVGRHIAAKLADVLASGTAKYPTLHDILTKAKAEWPA